MAKTVPAGYGPDGRAMTCMEVRNSNPSGERESNRVSNWMFRMVAILAVLLSGSMAKSQDLVFDGITPSPGSEISSFDFVLKFDLSKIIENNGEGDYGVGWVGYHNDKRPTKEESVTIYKGDPADKIVIGRCCDDYYNGGDADFVPSSEVKITVPGAIPEPGVTYTMVITNEFEVYTKETGAKPYPNSLIDYFSNPITYVFTGAAVSTEKLNVSSCSISANQTLDTLSEVSFTFSQPVSVNSVNPLVVKENNIVFATSVDVVLSEDKTLATYRFDNVSLLLNHAYVIYLPEGAVSSAINSVETNTAFNIPIIGTSVGHFLLSSSIPASGQKTIFSTVEGIFDMPEGFNIYVKPPYTLNLYGYLYKDEVSEVNLVGRLNGEVNSAKNGITWTNTYALEPETTYILNKPAGEFRAYEIATDKTSNDWYNGEVRIILNTPSIAEADIPSFVYQNPVNGQYEKTNTVLEPNSKVDYIGTFELALKDLNYEYEGKTYQVSINNDAKILVYDVTNGQESLICQRSITTREVEPADWHLPLYRAWGAGINTYFFEGHKYKLVIPAGALSINYKLLKNFATNTEWTFEFEGSTPTKAELQECTLQNNAELSELASVKWTFKGPFVQNDNLSVLIKHSYNTSTGRGSFTDICPTIVKAAGAYTYVSAYLPASQTGGAYQFETKDNDAYEIIFPEGLIYYEGDPSIKNSEMVYNIIPVKRASNELEYINVNIVTNDFMTTTQKAVKGQAFSYSINFKSTEENVAPWEIKSVTMDGKNLNCVNGVYTTPVLDNDTELTVEVEYVGLWAVEHETTGVWEIADSNVKIYSEESHIVVAGAQPGNKIAVYTAAGLLVGEARGKEETDLVRISVAPGQIYIVTVDGTAAKIQM